MKLIPKRNSKDLLATNLTWNVLDPFADKALGNDQIGQLITEGNRYAFKYKNGADSNLGATRTIDIPNTKGVKIYSLAAMIATSDRFKQTTSLVILNNTETEDGTVLVTGLVSGNIVIDELIKAEEVGNLYEKYVAACENTGRQYYIHSDLNVGEKESNFSLQELLDDKTARKIEIEPLKNDKKLVYLVYLIILSVVFFGGVKAWNWKQAQKIEEIRLSEESKKTPKSKYAASVKAMIEGQYIIPAQTYTKLFLSIESFPGQTNGWRLESIECTELVCDTEWESIGGTYENFKQATEAHPEWGKFTVKSSTNEVLGDMKTIKFSIPAIFEKTKLPDRATWPKAEDFALTLGTKWQQQPIWKGSLQTIQIQAIPEGVNELSIKSHSQIVYGMQWNAVNQPWSVAKRILKELPANVVLKSIKIQVSNNKLIFTGSGIAYVNN